MRIARRSDLAFSAILAVLVALGVGAVAWATGHGAGWGVPAFSLVLALTARRPLRRWRATRAPFQPDARAWLDEHVPIYRHAAPADRARFERDVQIALAELRFEGVGGADVSDRLRLAVAAGAALLLHGRPDWDLPAQRTILFYPERFDDQYDTDDRATFDGMVHPQGPVLLVASAVEAGWATADGYNVVLHELAHVLDFTAEGADGLPALMDPSSAEAWRALMREEMRRARMGRSILRGYAATNQAELFAVATEVFFERPARLREHHPALFDALAAFYALDPTTPEPPPTPQEDRTSWMARRWATGDPTESDVATDDVPGDPTAPGVTGPARAG